MKKLYFLFMLAMLGAILQAQPVTLKSIDAVKEFRLKLYYGNGGKGAFVQYEGKKEIIPLKVKSYRLDTISGPPGQPAKHYFAWNEMVNGKLNGTYKIMQMGNFITDATYMRAADFRYFNLELAEEEGDPDGEDQYLLHGSIISFNHFYHNKLLIEYPNGKKMKAELPFPDSPDAARQSIIEDYNFDGYDDLAFTIPDAGMGVYNIFTIYLYNPKTKRFGLFKEPDYSKSACSCLCDVAVDKKNKVLYTGCRGGASWHQDAYRFDKNGVLKWVASHE